MVVWLESVRVWLVEVHWELYFATGVMAVLWAASEVVIGYPDRPVRALRARGAWLLMVANAVFAGLALAAALTFVPESVSVWMAIGVGLSWQAMLRGGITIQPLPISSEAESAEGMGVPLDELYSRLQGFCVGQIQRELVGERVTLMEQVIDKLDIPELARIARLVTTAQAVAEAEPYIKRIENDQEWTSEQCEILLISLILDNHGSDILRDRVKEKQRRRRQQA